MSKTGWIQTKHKTLTSGKISTYYIGRIQFPGEPKERTKSFPRLGRIDKPGTAEHWLHQQRQELASRQTVHPTQREWTVGEWADHWLETCSGKEKGSIDAYQTVVNLDIKGSWLGDQDIRVVDRAMMGRWVKDLTTNRTWATFGNLRPSTAANRKTIAASIFRHAVDEGLLTRSPVRKLSVTSADDEIEQLDPEELPTVDDIWTLYDTAKKCAPRIAEMIIVAAGTGLRPGELVAVRDTRILRDPDGVATDIRVVDAKKMKEAGAIFGRPKTSRSRRTVPIGREVRDAIDRHLAAFPLQPGRAQGDLIFRSTRENAWAAQSLKVQWDRVRTRAGKPDMRFYILRHYYVSVLIAGGASPRLVMARVGHSDSKYTLERYARLWPRDDEVTASLSDAGLSRELGGNFRALRAV